MCANDSPSVKADGPTDAATLAADYEQYRLNLEEQPLPSYRAEELRSRIGVVREALANEGVAGAGQLQHLLRVVTEALADVRAAQVTAAPTGRDLTDVIPGFEETGRAYEITPTEQRKATNVLVNLLFTVVETPTDADRRAGHGDDTATNADRSDTAVTDTDRLGGTDAYAGPE
ncbi:MAG: hypothetical protein J07HB67_01084 [halophilic archaeon J07HB67]|nr:MAG: hypothetical protein J07HB67_01084 [halophilic archaeon J07HB67]